MVIAYSNIKGKKPVRVGDKVVGYIQGDRFIKNVRKSKHMLREPEGWAIDAYVWDKEIMPNAREFVIIDKETGDEYNCTTEVFNRLKGTIDRGFGKQYFLTLNHWQVVKAGERQLSLWEVVANA